MGFEGMTMEKGFEKKFFGKEEIVYEMGVEESMVKVQEEGIEVGMEEKGGWEEYVGGIGNVMLGMRMQQ